MSSISGVSSLIFLQKFSSQKLEHILEPGSVMVNLQSVAEFDRGSQLDLSIMYAYCLETFFKAASDNLKGEPLDLGCGSGEIFGRNYKSQKLFLLFEDFKNSVRASWTENEIGRCIPRNHKRRWILLSMRSIPWQLIIGIPLHQKDFLLRSGLPWKEKDHLVPKFLRADWRRGRMLLFTVRKKVVLE